MRRFVLAAAMAGMTFGAQAADLPDLPVLRGSLPAGGLSTTTRNWDGWYVGGQVGYASADMDFSHSVKSLTNFALRNSVLQAPIEEWALLSKNHAQATGFGAFFGRNWQWDDLVFGFEVNYNYFNSLQSSSTNSMSRTIWPNEVAPQGHKYNYDVTLAGAAALQLKDVVSFRGRTGWAVGNALPYLFGGLAVARVDVSRSATVSWNKFDDWDETIVIGANTLMVHHHDFIGSGGPIGAQEHRSNTYVPGWTAGLGMEYCLWGGLFMRGEWAYTRFTNTKDISFSTNEARLGVGYKF
jgi:outer membrane immunogenic protein